MDAADADNEHKTYKRRWLVLLTVAALNVSINTLMSSYSSVVTAAATYYEKEPADIDLLTTLALIGSFVAAVPATWFVEYIGFRWTVMLTGFLPLVGGAIRMLSTFPGLNENMDKDIQYNIGLVAQFIVGLSNPIAFSLPTKVAVAWFPLHEAPLASGLIMLAFILGLTIANGINAFIFSDPDYIQWMNITYFIPTVFIFACCVIFVKSDRPPTPPSKSAKLEHKAQFTYLQKLKSLAVNKQFLLLVTIFGGLQGSVIGLMSKMYQLGCAVGYDENTMATGITVLLVCGTFGALAASLLFRKTGMVEEQAKVTIGIATVLAIVILILLLEPDQEAWLITTLAFTGLLAVGILPVGVQLILENTFPVDPPTTLLLMFMVTGLTGIVVLSLGGLLEQTLPDYLVDIEVCTQEGSLFEAKDHTNFVLFLMCFISLLSVLCITLVRSTYRRARVDAGKEEEGDEEDSQKEVKNANGGII